MSPKSPNSRRPEQGGIEVPSWVNADPQRIYAIRRRRAVAALVLGIASVLILVLLLGGGSKSPHVAAAIVRAPKPTLDQRESAAIDKVLSYTPYISRGSPNKREVALTFDDGPGPYSPQVIDILTRENVPATFFVIGNQTISFGPTTTRQVRDGFVIGNHTYAHPMMANLSRHDQAHELDHQSSTVEALDAPPERLFRPPYGSFNDETLRLLKRRHMLMVLWSTNTADFTQPGTDAIVKSAVDGAVPGAIILMHDAGGTRTQTVAALPKIIRKIRRKHLQLVTVPQLVMDDPPPRNQPLPVNLSGD